MGGWTLNAARKEGVEIRTWSREIGETPENRKKDEPNQEQITLQDAIKGFLDCKGLSKEFTLTSYHRQMARVTVGIPAKTDV